MGDSFLLRHRPFGYFLARLLNGMSERSKEKGELVMAVTQSKCLKLTFVGMALTTLLVVGEARASVCTLSGPNYFGSFALNSNGTLGPSDCTSVVQQDKTWSNFVFGGLPAGTEVQFTFGKVGGQDVHAIAFQAPFGPIGGTFTWSYDISVNSGNPVELFDVASSIGQSRGSSSLMTMLLDNNSNTYMTNFTQTGPLVTSGTTTVAFKPGADSLVVTDTLTIGPQGSDVTSVANSYTQLAVPEPGTLALFGVGIIGAAGVLRRKINP
jgi:hypothetical protein